MRQLIRLTLTPSNEGIGEMVPFYFNPDLIVCAVRGTKEDETEVTLAIEVPFSHYDSTRTDLILVRETPERINELLEDTII